MEIFKCTLCKVEVLHNLHRHYMKIKRGADNQGQYSNHAKYRTQGFLWLQDADVVKNTPTNIVYYYFGCCATSSCACVHPRKSRRGSSDLESHPVAMVLLLRKKTPEKDGDAQNMLSVRDTSGQGLFRSRDFVTSGQKGSTRADIAQLPVAHAQNILPNRAHD